MFLICLIRVLLFIFLKLNFCILDKIVKGIFWGFVVVKMKIICVGGFFNVFNKVLKVFLESIWILLIM